MVSLEDVKERLRLREKFCNITMNHCGLTRYVSTSIGRSHQSRSIGASAWNKKNEGVSRKEMVEG